MYVAPSLPAIQQPPRLDDLIDLFNTLIPNTWSMVNSGINKENSQASLMDMDTDENSTAVEVRLAGI